MSEFPRITDVEVRNVMKIKYVHVTPGVITIIGGDNEQGKSSFLDAVAMTLGGPRLCPKDVPIRKGEKHAEVKIELSESPHMPACYVHQQWSLRKDGSVRTSLHIIAKDKDLTEVDEENPEGLPKSAAPRTTLANLVSPISFDPLEFLRKKPKEQAEQLQTMLGLDFTATNKEIDKHFNMRTEANRDFERAKATLQNLPKHDDAPDEPIDPATVAEEFEAIQQANRKVDDEKAELLEIVRDWELAVPRTNEACKATKQIADEIAELEEKLAKLKNAFKMASENERVCREEERAARVAANEAEDNIKALAYQDTSHLKDRMSEIETINRKVRENSARAAQKGVVEMLQDKTEILTEKIEELRKSKLMAVSQAEWPIKGMGFDEDGYLSLDGLPFAQASTSSKLKACVSIGVMMNPKLKFMIIREGSLLDEQRLLEMAQYAGEHGCQLFVERVSKGDECHVIMQDGEDIKGQSDDDEARAEQSGSASDNGGPESVGEGSPVGGGDPGASSERPKGRRPRKS